MTTISDQHSGIGLSSPGSRSTDALSSGSTAVAPMGARVTSGREQLARRATYCEVADNEHGS
jgi:hypothetical protein